MKSILIIAALVTAAAGPAAADFGKIKSPTPGFQKAKPATGMSSGPSPYAARPMPSYGSPYSGSSSTSRPRTYGSPPAADAYKPFQPYKSQPGTSLYGPDSRKKP
jgi:hypothetical protein